MTFTQRVFGYIFLLGAFAGIFIDAIDMTDYIDGVLGHVSDLLVGVGIYLTIYMITYIIITKIEESSMKNETRQK